MNLQANKIESFDAIPHLPALKEINLQGNPITKLAEIGKLIAFSNLASINLLETPIAEEKGDDLRKEVLILLDGLKIKSFNGEEVTEEEETEEEKDDKKDEKASAGAAFVFTLPPPAAPAKGATPPVIEVSAEMFTSPNPVLRQVMVQKDGTFVMSFSNDMVFPDNWVQEYDKYLAKQAALTAADPNPPARRRLAESGQN